MKAFVGDRIHVKLTLSSSEMIEETRIFSGVLSSSVNVPLFPTSTGDPNNESDQQLRRNHCNPWNHSGTITGTTRAMPSCQEIVASLIRPFLRQSLNSGESQLIQIRGIDSHQLQIGVAQCPVPNSLKRCVSRLFRFHIY